MNTSALEAKLSAFKLLNMISEAMGTAFAPYAEATLTVMIENLDYKFSKKIRSYALKTLNNLLTAVGEPNNVILFANHYTPAVIKMIQANIELENVKELKMILKGYWNMIKNLNDNNTKGHKAYMNDQVFSTLGPLFNKILNLVKEAKAKTLKTIGNKNLDFDEEDLENIKDELAKSTAASTYVMEISGQLVVNFGAAVAPMVKTHLLNFFALNLHGYKNLSESELLDATCFFCDFAEYSYGPLG